MNKWLNFKLLSSLILLVIVTVYSLISESSTSYDIWFCVWAICVVRFVDVLDEMA